MGESTLKWCIDFVNVIKSKGGFEKNKVEEWIGSEIEC